ncbi:hypothetical protein [Streptomyces sp. NBC_00687]|uniref:hypothetical protein n=1 Tax=Streptomyces sp. NBC_00687 TaxID=2975807 RepID=UPI002B1D4D63|nr:hypothetical protein [Streptomyces sp. NBC_00687]
MRNTKFVTIPWRYQGSRAAVVEPDASQLWAALKDDRTIDGKDASGKEKETKASSSPAPSPSKSISGQGIAVSVYNGSSAAPSPMPTAMSGSMADDARSADEAPFSAGRRGCCASMR